MGKEIPHVDVDFFLTADESPDLQPSQEIQLHIHVPEEEIAFGPSGWLWDYLRRSGQRGYFLPLSGGADSSSTAALVAIMCQRVLAALKEGTEQDKSQVLEDVRRITRSPDYVPMSWQELCSKIFTTCYMMSQYSGEETTSRAANLAKTIGSNHTSISIEPIVKATKEVFKNVRYHSESINEDNVKREVAWGSTYTEDIALQNVQARGRMVMAYFMSQLMCWATEPNGTGSLLVLGSANVDEALRGYFTKYDCSAADINPIGGINKKDLRSFLRWAAENRGISVLNDVANAVPTAELRPEMNEEVQSDEKDMGMSYDELSDLGYCRKVLHQGPLSCFITLRSKWNHKRSEWKSPSDNGTAVTPSIRVKEQPKSFDEKVAQKVKDFFFFHAVNRHKMTTLTPSYHAVSYSPDDNRYDLRPFLQNPNYDVQFTAIDELLERIKA